MRKYNVLLALLIILQISLRAQDVERERPAEWESLIYGGRFLDRFQPMPKIGKLSSDVWGQEAVKPRYVENGIEASKWSYWGGNIYIDADSKYHLFVCRWLEDDPKGHMAWPKSEVVHAVSDQPDGPFKVHSIVGEGHNPEIQQLKDGSFLLYASKNFKQTYYHGETLDGPWELRELSYDPRERRIDGHMTNNTFCRREDGSMLMVSRGGGIWLSEDGLPPYEQLTSESVYPPYDGRYEDPIVWRTNIQYHLIVNDWLGRIAYYMRSKDGVNWKLDAGEAYLPGIARHENGHLEDWYKFERMKVLQDKYGRAYQANFAVADTIKKQDLGNDNHSSKNLCIPLTVGRLLELKNATKIDKGTEEIQLLIKSEPGFNAQTDVNIKSLRFGASEEVDFGKGCEVIKTKKLGEDLLVTFSGKGNGLTNDNFVAKLLGETKKGDLLFGFARLPWLSYNEPLLSCRYPRLTRHGKKLMADIEVEDFGQFASDKTEMVIEYLNDGKWEVVCKGKVPALKPYEKTNLRLEGKNIGERNQAIEMRITIKNDDHIYEILNGNVVIR